MKNKLFKIIVGCIIPTIVSAQKIDLSIGGGAALTGFFDTNSLPAGSPLLNPSGMIKGGVMLKRFNIGARVDVFGISTNNKLSFSSNTGMIERKNVRVNWLNPAIMPSAFFEHVSKLGKNQFMFGINAGVVLGFYQRYFESVEWQYKNYAVNTFGISAGLQFTYRRAFSSNIGAFIDFSPRYIHLITMDGSDINQSTIAFPINVGVSFQLP